MLRTTLASLLVLTLTGAALAQESAIVGASRPDAIDGRAGTKLVFTAVGQADDVVVLRMIDGTPIAEATLTDLAKGASFDAILAPKKLAGKSSAKPSVAVFAQAIDLSAQASAQTPELGKPLDVAVKSALAADPKPFAVLITISKAPAKFHGGSVALYRGKTILDADRINLR